MVKLATKLVLVILGLGTFYAVPDTAQAQLFYRHHHHHNHGNSYYQPQHGHDAAGHIVDRYGHHVDAYGRHTGGVGLYDQHSIPNTYGNPYTANYGGYDGGSYSATAVAPNRSPDFGLPITVVCPETIPAPINYSLNGVRHTIRPGERQTLVNDRRWVVEFDRGSEFGLARYYMTPGVYEFEATPQGWELFRYTTPQATAGPLPAPNPPVPAPQLPATAPKSF